MKLSDDTALNGLNQLLQVCRASQRGYQQAVTNASDPDLARLFSDYAGQRSKYIAELEDRIRTLRSDPAQGTLPGASMHQGWMEVKSASAFAPLHALLEECERGEDMAVAAYRTALQQRDMDEQSRRLIQRQYEGVQAAHDRVRQLRDSATYAHR
jgi:uncharacterized protein (TIGR02284 family)